MLRGNMLGLVKAILDGIRGKADKAAKSGLEKGKDFLVARVKETVGVPAGPQRRASGGRFTSGFRAVTPATVGAPPRKVTGNLQAKVEGSVVGRSIRIFSRARSKRGFPYGVYHEAKQAGRPGSGKHPYVAPTIKRFKEQLRAIIGNGFKAEFRK
jgi:hypothetical protein